jgi:3'(2'), 5'-bisphosphate nucleotidase
MTGHVIELTSALPPTLAILARIAIEAGARLMAARAAGAAEATRKADGSPVCAADRDAEAFIGHELEAAGLGLVLVGEESAETIAALPADARLAIVDPLDGTRDFIEGGGDFTVNIAVVERGRPVLGVIYAPVEGLLAAGDVAAGLAFSAIVPPGGAMGSAAIAVHRAALPRGLVRTAIRSSRQADAAVSAFLEAAGVAASLNRGAALKFALMLRGDAQIYPRFTPVMEWDVAAGDAIVTAAGGAVTDRAGAPLTYGRLDRGFLVPEFIARLPLPD